MHRRVPPHSTDAECGVLGCLLIRPDLLADVLETGLSAGDFYVPKWAAAFEAVTTLAARGEAVDTVTVADELAGGAHGVAPGGADLVDVIAEVPSPSHAVTYAGRVAAHSRLRRVIAACAEITDAAYGPDAKGDPQGFADLAERTLLAATAAPADHGTPGLLVELLDDAIAELRRRSAGEAVGVPTGLVDLDRLTGGLRPGQLVVLGARPSMGKSALALDIALNVAGMIGPALFVSAEMGSGELANRVLAGGGVPSDRILGARLDEIDFRRLGERRDDLAGVPLLIDDSPGATLASIRARARRQASRGGLSLLAVDYLQLIDAPGRRERREAEVAEISRGLKALARELQVPVLAAAQLNRAVELRADKRPMLADLRESGQLEQDADLVLLLHRPAVYDLAADQGAAELIVAKHRNGPTGMVPLTWLPARMHFVNAAPVGVTF